MGTKILSSVLLFVLCLSSFPSLSLAQGAGGSGSGTLMSSVNLQGVGAVALQCINTNSGNQSPFGQMVGATAGGAGGAAIGQNIGGETGAQIGGALGTVAGGLAGEYIGGAINNIGENVQDNVQDAVTGTIESAASNLPIVGAFVGGDAVPVEVKEDSKEAEETAAATEKLEVKENCLDRIAQWAAITVMDRMTLATLNWINSGYEGKHPFFVEDQGNFFANLATQELLGFSATFSGDANLYPFGDTIVRSLIFAFQTRFEQTMINNLNTILMNGSQAQWSADFSVGGWAGYTAFVEPNNNIFGAYLESSRNIGNRLVGTRNSRAINIQAELQQGMGFLSQRICVETENGGAYIPEGSIQHIKTGVSQITQTNQIPPNVYIYITACEADDVFDENGDGEADSDGLCEGFDEDIIAVAENFRGRSNCIQWRNQTPGTIIAQSASDALGTSKQQLLLVDELNENLGLILDAMLFQFLSEGLSAFTENNENNVLAQQVNGENPGQQPNSISFIESVNGTDGFPGIIETQEQYLEDAQVLLELQAEIFQRTLDLDYCVPGPNPLWQSNSSNSINEAFSIFPAYEDYPQSSWLQITPSFFVPAVAIIGTFTPSTNEEILAGYLHAIYSSLLTFYTGLSGEFDGELLSRDGQALPMLFDTFSDYASLINQRFIYANNDFTGNVRSLAYQYFFQLGAVNEAIVSYETGIQIVEENLEDLIGLREEYADIERDYIVDELSVAVNQQGIQTLADNLQTFQSFSDAQVTYIGVNGQNSAYHNAVIALEDELGQAIAPPTSYPAYQAILEEMVNLLPNIVFQAQLDAVALETTEALEKIGNQSDPESLIGLVYSCIGQVSSPGFSGFEERKPYPFPLSPDIPGLANLPTTDTFLEDIGIEHSNDMVIDNITLPMIPFSDLGDSIDPIDSLETLETRFINIGLDLY